MKRFGEKRNDGGLGRGKVGFPVPHSDLNSLQLSKSYEKIEKALGAGDPSKGGYVSLNYLKIVLDTFVHQLPRRIFIQLMKR